MAYFQTYIHICFFLPFVISFQEEIQAPFYIDPIGIQINWTNPSDGWDAPTRKGHLELKNMTQYQRQVIPKLTPLGYKKVDIPPELYQKILEDKSENIREEPCSTDFRLIRNCFKVNENGSYESNKNNWIIDLKHPFVMDSVLEAYLRPILEEWTNLKLRYLQRYGIRRYTRGARVWTHVDDVPDFVVGAILQIDQKVEEDWALNVLDHEGTPQRIVLKPGQMLIWESAAVPHGRQYALKGDYYDNLMVHFTSDVWEKYLKYVDVDVEVNTWMNQQRSSIFNELSMNINELTYKSEL